MAKPIELTPTLRGKDAEKLLEIMSNRYLKKSVRG